MGYSSSAAAGAKPPSKLSLLSLPPKPAEPTGMLTPPFRPPASIPFLWEEAPGKPRPSSAPKPTAVRSLDLPPRLLYDASATLPSSPTVLYGPFVARSSSCSSLPAADGEKSHLCRKDSLRLIWKKRGGGKVSAGRQDGHDDGESARGFSSSSSSCSSSSSSSSTSGSADVCGRFRGECGDAESQVRITRFRRSGSLANVSSASSRFWTTIYGSLRHVVPWKARKLKKDGTP